MARRKVGGTCGACKRAGSGVPLRRVRWQLTAVEARQKRQRPPKQEHRRAGVSLRQSTSRHPLLRGAHPPSPANSPLEAGRDVAMCRRKYLRAPTFGGSVTATSRPVYSFVALILRWRTTSAALPSCGAARYGVQKVRPPRLSPRSAAVRRQVLTGQFDQSTPADGRLKLPCGIRRGSRTASRLGFLPITALRLSERIRFREPPTGGRVQLPSAGSSVSPPHLAAHGHRLRRIIMRQTRHDCRGQDTA